MRTCVRVGLLLAVAAIVLVSSPEASASPGATDRVSVDSAGVQGTGDSGAWGRPAVSADSRYVAFESFAKNLVDGDTNNASDIFVRDRDMGTTARVSVTSGGSQASGFSFQPAISSDGRYVAFDSDAPDLVSGDSNNASDVFVHDRQTGATTRVSVDSAGAQADASSYSPAVSSDGRYVAFYSEATNLVSDDSNGADDIFVRDRDTDGDGIFDEAEAVSTARVSVDNGGGQADGASSDPAVSVDGRFVAFYSEATNLVLEDTNGTGDIFVRDRQTGATERVSVDSAGSQANGGSYDAAVGWDGRLVAFYSAATNLVAGDTNNSWDVFVRDRATGVTTRVSVDRAGNQGTGTSSDPAISADGRYVTFRSGASNLVPSDTNGAEDIFLHNLQMGAIMRVSVDSAGGQANGGSSAPGVSTDGRFVAFYSRASNLVPEDTNGRQDVFVHERPAVVGGIAELPEAAGQSGGPQRDYALLAALAAAALALFTAGAWYAARRRPR